MLSCRMLSARQHRGSLQRTPWASATAAVLQEVCEHLDSADVAAARLVCRSWCSGVSELVEKVVVHNWKLRHNAVAHIQHLQQQFPCINKLMWHQGNTSARLSTLNHVVAQISCWRTLRELWLTELPCDQVVAIPGLMALTSLTLQFCRSPISKLMQAHGVVLQDLGHLKHLRSLTIHHLPPSQFRQTHPGGPVVPLPDLMPLASLTGLTHLSLSCDHIHNNTLLPLMYLHQLQALNLQSTAELNPQGFAQLSCLPQLQHLEFGVLQIGTQIKASRSRSRHSAWAVALQRFAGLSTFVLKVDSLPEGFTAGLARMPRLSCLSLSVSDMVLSNQQMPFETVQPLQTMKALELNSIVLSDSTLQSIAHLQGLRKLSLKNIRPAVSPWLDLHALSTLSSLSNLQSVSLHVCAPFTQGEYSVCLTNQAISTIAKSCTKLTSLEYAGEWCSEGGKVTALKSLNRLKELSLIGRPWGISRACLNLDLTSLPSGLVSLSLAHVKLTQLSLRGILDQLPFLQRLKLRACGIGPQDLTPVGPYLSSLTHLWLGVPSDHTSERMLSRSWSIGCGLSDESSSSDDLQWLRHCAGLISLELHTPEMDLGMGAVANAARLKKLKVLSLNASHTSLAPQLPALRLSTSLCQLSIPHACMPAVSHALLMQLPYKLQFRWL